VRRAAFDQLPRRVAVSRLERVEAVALEVAGDDVADDRSSSTISTVVI
jgi:hypothetical protein